MKYSDPSDQDERFNNKSHDRSTKGLLERLILDVLEKSSSFCMDVEDERKALADALTVDILGRFKADPKRVRHSKTVLARILPGLYEEDDEETGRGPMF